MAWGNEELARLFSEMAELLELTGETGFRVRAYDRGARALSGHGADLSSLSERELAAIPGVGKAIAAKVREYLDTGRVAKLEELRAQVPPGLRALVRVPGLGPAKARLVHERLGVSSPEELAGAVAAGRVAGLPGMGQRTEANLRRALERMAQPGDGIPLAVALPVAETLRDRLAGVAGVERVEVAGSLRRMKAAVHDIDLLAAATDPASVNRAFTELPQVAEVAALGDTKASVRTRDGLQVDLRTVQPEVWGAALQYFTGSAAHNVRIRERAVRGPQAQRVRPVRAGRRAGRGHRRGGRHDRLGMASSRGAARGPRRGRRRPPGPAPGAGQPGRRRRRLPLPHRPVA
jgi:DNA polymerase (family 10)